MSLDIPVIRASTNLDTYSKLALKNQLARETLRELPLTKNVQLTNLGVPIVPKHFINAIRRQEAVNKYTAELYRLNEPLEVLLQDDNREALNEEIMRHGSGAYTLPEIHVENVSSHGFENSPETEEGNKEFWEALQRMGFFKNEGKRKASTKRPSKLGSKMDWSPEAKKERDETWRLMSEQRRAFVRYANIRNNFSQFALWGMFSADPGYITTVLTSEGLGLRHPNEYVRLGAVNLLTGLALVTPFKLEQDLREFDKVSSLFVGGDIEGEKKATYREIYDDALSIVKTFLASNSFPLKDRSHMVRSKANSLEEILLNFVQALTTDIKDVSSF